MKAQFVDDEAEVKVKLPKPKKSKKVPNPRKKPSAAQKCEMCGGLLLGGQEICSPEEDPYAMYHIDCWKLLDEDYEEEEEDDEEEDSNDDVEEEDEEPEEFCEHCDKVRNLCDCSADETTEMIY